MPRPEQERSALEAAVSAIPPTATTAEVPAPSNETPAAKEPTPPPVAIDPAAQRIKDLEAHVFKLKQENIEKRLKEKETEKEKDSVLLANQEYKALAESLQTKLAEIETEAETTRASLQTLSADAKKYQEILLKRDADVNEQAKKLSADERAILSDLQSIEAKERFLKITTNRADAKASPNLNFPSNGAGANASKAKPKRKNLF